MQIEQQKFGISLKNCCLILLHGFIAFVFVLFFYMPDAVFADSTKEYKVKAVFTLNFAKYT